MKAMKNFETNTLSDVANKIHSYIKFQQLLSELRELHVPRESNHYDDAKDEIEDNLEYHFNKLKRNYTFGQPGDLLIRRQFKENHAQYSILHHNFGMFRRYAVYCGYILAYLGIVVVGAASNNMSVFATTSHISTSEIVGHVLMVIIAFPIVHFLWAFVIVPLFEKIIYEVWFLAEKPNSEKNN